MRCISWNCRGLGNPLAVRALSRLIKKENPQLVFLMETKQSEMEFETTKKKVGFEYGLAAGCDERGRGRAGGVALLWRNSLEVRVTSFSNNHICAEIVDAWDFTWFFSGIYGFPEDVNKHKTIELIRALTAACGGGWVCVGDFNLICGLDEKIGGRPLTWFRWDNSEK